VDDALVGGLFYGLYLALPIGLIVALVAYHPTITPTERLRWTTTSLRRNSRRWFMRAALAAFGASLIVPLSFALILGRADLAVDLAFVVLGALPLALIIGVLFGLLSGLQTQSYVTPPAPGKAIYMSKRNALLSGLGVGLGVALSVGLVLFALILGLGGGLINALVFGPPIGLVGGLIVGFLTALQRGGGAYLRHHVLRWVLVRTRSIPRDYVAFLDYGTQLILLRRRGGGYEFIHRLLLEHFAALEPRSWRAHASQDLSQGSAVAGPSVDQQPAFVVPEPNRGPHSGISG
jgi:hypothetical protein